MKWKAYGPSGEPLTLQGILEPVLTAIKVLTAAGIIGVALIYVGTMGLRQLPGKTGYHYKYYVSEDHIFIDEKPHDCAFDRAPIGNKYCHYDEQVTQIKNGKGEVTDVFVTWEKVLE